MALFDAFTGDPGRRAAQDTRRFLGQLQADVNTNIAGAQDLGLGELRFGREGALGALEPAFAEARTALGGALPGARSDLLNYGQQGIDALLAGGAGAGGALGDAIRSWSPLSDMSNNFAGLGSRYSGMSADALGLNGPEGLARANEAFTTSGAYNFNLDQGLNAINRARAASGQLVGGNTDRSAQTFGSGLASQEWGGWMDRLGLGERFFNPLAAQTRGQVAQGEAAGYTNLADLRTRLGLQQGNMLTGLGTGLANLGMSGAGGLADLLLRGSGAIGGAYTGTGQNMANLISALSGQRTNFASNLMEPMADTYSNEANAAMTGSRNLWNAIGSVAGAIAGGPIGASLGGSLGSLGSFMQNGPAGSFGFAA